MRNADEMWHFQLCCGDWMIHVVWRASVSTQRLQNPPDSLLGTCMHHIYVKKQACPFLSICRWEKTHLVPSFILTDMKGAACAGYHGNRWMSVGAAAVGRFRRRVPEPLFDIITIFNGMFSVVFISALFSFETPLFPFTPWRDHVILPKWSFSLKMPVDHDSDSPSPHTWSVTFTSFLSYWGQAFLQNNAACLSFSYKSGWRSSNIGQVFFAFSVTSASLF